MNMGPAISVLLSTYNGERYLVEQLDTLWQQSTQDFELVVRDDGSSDGTLRLLEEARQRRPDRIRLITDGQNRLGPRASFASLLQHTHAPYVAFCDQDDHWFANKLANGLQALRALEAQWGADTPVLSCSDVVVTDGVLNTLFPSYFAKHHFSVHDGRDLQLPRLLFRNFAIGATTMVNRALAQQALSMPEQAIMHDWWLALLACTLGKTVVLEEPQMLYRQHGANAVGSRRRPVPRSIGQVSEYLNWAQLSSARCIRQAMALRDACHRRLPPAQMVLLDSYHSFPRQSALQRAATVLHTRAFKPGLMLNGLHVYACMTAPL